LSLYSSFESISKDLSLIIKLNPKTFTTIRKYSIIKEIEAFERIKQKKIKYMLKKKLIS